MPFAAQYTAAILELDAIATGEDRSVVLLENMDSSILYVSDGRVRGAYFPGLMMGLVIANDGDAGVALMQRRLMDRGTCMVPAGNKQAVNYLNSIGFQFTKASKRMRLGKPRPWRADHIYNVTGGMLG